MNSFISWIGGKKSLKKKIIEQFPKNYDRYIEVFGGAGWVLFDKEKHADMEVQYDIPLDGRNSAGSGELKIVYSVLGSHCVDALTDNDTFKNTSLSRLRKSRSRTV